MPVKKGLDIAHELHFSHREARESRIVIDPSYVRITLSYQLDAKYSSRKSFRISTRGRRLG